MNGASDLFLAGPTAVGKSEVALLLAERLAGEIISVDSMQVYRGMDIGTAKPTAAERRRVQQHLIDVAELTEPFDAARYCELAEVARREIHSRDRRAILCGGTGLYFRALLSGLGESPAADPELRKELEATPLEKLLAELKESDPAMFERIDQRNPRRVVRAVEVIRLTGRPFSALRSDWITDEVAGPNIICLHRDPPDLKSRIERRVDRMFAEGLVAETERLLNAGLRKNRTAMQAIGYRQVVEHLAGERSLAETIALVKQRTWQFARRQLTWFRRQPGVRWLNVEPAESAAAVADRVLAELD